jgi:hypothetical protein
MDESKAIASYARGHWLDNPKDKRCRHRRIDGISTGTKRIDCRFHG